MKYLKLFEEIDEKRFIVDEDKFQLFLGDVLVSETGFEIWTKDEYFNQKYLTIHTLSTAEGYKNKGFAEYLLQHIFNYVKDDLNLNIITLIVYKENYKAVNLYFKCGFEIYEEYDNSYCLIKKL